MSAPVNSQTIRRMFVVDGLRIEERVKGKPRSIFGHAAVFNQWSEDLGGFREQIAPGAFTESIAGRDDVRALINHNPDLLLGRNLAGTLRLAEDARGLAIEIDPPDTQVARDLLVSMERGDITQMSFAFSTLDDSWETRGKQPHRTLLKVRLFDVSPVTYPAYPQTDVSVRSLAAEHAEILADGLRRLAPPVPHGMSLAEAKRKLRIAEAGG
jgi:HK97 family phage prohead protease